MSVWFAGKLINENGAMLQDRLGTNRVSGSRYYPYGERIGTGGVASRAGTDGTFRVISFLTLSFEAHNIERSSTVIGIGKGGDQVVISRPSVLFGHPIRADHIDLVTGRGELIFRWAPTVRGVVAYFAEISPDSRRLIFVGSLAPMQGKAEYGLHLMDSSGASTLVATSESGCPGSIGWSAKGDSIVYDSAGRIFLLDMATRSSTFFAEGSDPTWSPDGNWIAYRKPDGMICFSRPDGTRSAEWLANTQVGRGLQWSPDGRYLLFTDARSGEIKVFVMGDGRSAVVLKAGDGYDSSRLRWTVGANEWQLR